MCENEKQPSDSGSVSNTLLSADAKRYRWLRREFTEGRETYLPEGIVSEDQLDEYIDAKLRELGR